MRPVKNISLFLLAHQLPEFRLRPKTCKDVKLRGQSYIPNGDNLIYPLKDCNTSIKVYCDHAEGAKPKEYITVSDGNYVTDWKGTTEFEMVCSILQFYLSLRR